MTPNPHIKGPNKIFLVLNLIFGLYFLNFPFQLVKIPEVVSSVDPWIIFVGGILIIFGAINYFRMSKNKRII